MDQRKLTNIKCSLETSKVRKKMRNIKKRKNQRTSITNRKELQTW